MGFAILLCLSTSMECVAQSNQPTLTATQANRKSLSVVVYGSGAALVRDERRLEIPAGVVNLHYAEVSRQLVPDSVALDSPQLTLLRQTYASNYLNSYSLLQAFVGKTVTAVLVKRENGSDVETPVHATVLASTPSPVLVVNGQIEVGLHVDHYIIPSLPGNLSPVPTLRLTIDNQQPGERDVVVSYLTNGVNWTANYVLNAAADWKTAELSARAEVTNRSGTDYRDAALQLVAGEVRRINESPYPPRVAVADAFGVAGSRAMMQAVAPPQNPFAGYHAYTLQEPVDLLNNASEMVPLVAPKHIQITRTYEVNGSGYYNQASPEASTHSPVELRLAFQNAKTNGIPLPAGIVRVYKDDAQGRPLLIGEDRLTDTPPGEKATLDLGNAFDVTAEIKQTDFKRLGPRETEASYAITLRNHQQDAITVIVNQPLSGDWEITNSSLPYTKVSSTLARFDAPVPAGGETTLTFRVHVNWGM